MKNLRGSVVVMCVVAVLGHFCGTALADDESNALELIKTIINKGASNLGIPVLDPLNLVDTVHIDNLNIDSYISLESIDLTYIHATGISKFTSNKFSIDAENMKTDFDFTFPEILFEVGKYDLVGKNSESESLEGHGALSLTVNDLQLSGSMELAVDPNTDVVYLKTMDASLSLGNDDLMITGLNGENVSGFVDLDPLLPWVADQLVTFVDNKLKDASITSAELSACIVNNEGCLN